MANRITIEISEYPHEILKRTVEEINEISPLKLSKKQITDLIVFTSCSFIHEKILPAVKDTIDKDRQISLIWPLLSKMKDEPDNLFEVMGEFIVNYKPDVDEKSLKNGIEVLKELYKAWLAS
jgi:hypothetical protein